ncbi:MAG: portal protein [Candidatus Hydrogenedentales bacterium]|jgi:hypothetical protein
MESKTTDSDHELNNMLDEMQQSGMDKTREWVSVFQEALHYFFSDQLQGKKRHKDWDWVVINYIWPSAMQEISKLSKNHAKLIVTPWEEDDVEAAEVFQGALQWLWQKPLNMRLNHIAAMLDSKLWGYRVSKIYWDNKVEWDDRQKKWIGDVRYKLWHPACFWASPEAESIDEAEAIGTLRYVTLEEAKKQFPDFADELEQEAQNNFEGYEQSSGDTILSSIHNYFSGSDLKGVDEIEDAAGASKLLDLILDKDKAHKKTSGDVKMVEIGEIWFRDNSTVKRKIKEDVPLQYLIDTGEAYEGEDGLIYNKSGESLDTSNWPTQIVDEYDEPKFPYGRHIIRVGKTILNSKEEDQRWNLKKWPFVVTPHYLLPHMWQGINAVSMYKTAQDMINVTASHLVNNMKLYGDPKVAVEEGAIAMNPRTKKHYKIGAGAGSILRMAKNGLKKFKIIEPKDIGNGVLQLYQLHAQEFKNLTGLQSIGRGEQLKSGTTATEANALAINSNDRISFQQVYEEEWIRQVACRIAEICQYYYEPDRYVRIIGEDNRMGIVQVTQRAKDAHYDIDVEPGTTLPYDEEKRLLKLEKAYQLLSSPMTNPMLPTMLRELGIPNYKKLLKQSEAYNNYLQFAQMLTDIQEGKMDPQSAVQMLGQKVMQVYQSSPNAVKPTSQAG